MSASIIISNLGPIKDVEIDLSRDMNLIIGPQASGKSTLAKIVYFCKRISDYSVDYLVDKDNFLSIPKRERYISYLKYIRKKYMDSFGTTKHYSRLFRVEYKYKNGERITIVLEAKGYVRFAFSKKIEEQMKELIDSTSLLYENNRKSEGTSAYEALLDNIELIKETRKQLTKTVRDIFGDDSSTLYIPAGRSLLSVLSEQIESVKADALDLPMRDFINYINTTRTRFGIRLDTMVGDYVKTIKGQIKNSNVELAERIIKEILKAEYVNDADGEKLYIDESHWVKLIYGSSGQHEALWILLILFIIILEDRKTFVIIEEPEAHLYPFAQRKIVELISLTMNSSQSQMMITTHSPYVMTTANLLIQSSYVENRIRSNPSEIVIPRQLRINHKNVCAYKLDGLGNMVSIIDDDTGLMRTGEIDKLSEIINDESEKLIDLEIKYGL